MSYTVSIKPGSSRRVRFWWPPQPIPPGTPLFLVAGGIVLEQGGILSHPAIVAREYGLPAVVNVPHATRLIRTGQQLLVDANRGRVVVEDSDPR